MTAYPILSTITFLPLVGAALILLFGGERLTRWIALATTLATLAASAPLYWNFDKASSALQFVDSAAVGTGRSTQTLSQALKTLVSGHVQHYGLIMAAGILALLALAVLAL